MTGLFALCLAAPVSAFAQAPAAPAAQPPAAAPEPDLFTAAQVQPMLRRVGSLCEAEQVKQFNRTETKAYYEVGCRGGYGEVAVIDLPNTDTSPVGIVHCLDALPNYTCALTTQEANVAQRDQRVTQLRAAAQAKGVNCDVARNRNAEPRADNPARATEITCTGRPDSVMLLTTGENTEVMNCARSWLEGFPCRLTERPTWIPAVGADLKLVRPQTTCVVADAEPLGRGANDHFLETTCADGLSGWVIVYPKGVGRPKEVIACSQATLIGNGCQMRANVEALARN